MTEIQKKVLLLHGMCSSSNVFGPSKGPGLIKLLSPDFDLFSGKLRVYETCPNSPALDFDEILEVDIPEIWIKARQYFAGNIHGKQSSEENPAVLGYSMGGILALLATARGIIKPSRLMILGSPFTFMNMPFYPAIMKTALKIAEVFPLKRIPVRLGGRILFWYLFYFSRTRRKNAMLVFHALLRAAGSDIPIETLSQAYKWIQKGFICNRTGCMNYLEELSAVNIPVMFVAGERDIIASPASVKAGYERISSSQKEFIVIPDTSHLELVAGDKLYETAKIANRWFSK
ncbi:MAG: alpha/beta fold hydrolase [Candidatus Riflebacteria bacterium]|nr:alpha/beta fold hydrolase [Candidatus Riflebacteria bacterium]